MQRLCFLLPDVEHARALVNELEASGLAEHRIHLVGREDTPLETLPDAGYERTDFLPALERGLAAGAAVGLVAGLVALRVAGGVLGGAAVALITLEASLVSGWLTALAGSAFPNSRLERFAEAIDAGRILMMIDVAPDEAAAMTERVRRHHPEAEVQGFEPPPPVVP